MRHSSQIPWTESNLLGMGCGFTSQGMPQQCIWAVCGWIVIRDVSNLPVQLVNESHTECPFHSTPTALLDPVISIHIAPHFLFHSTVLHNPTLIRSYCKARFPSSHLPRAHTLFQKTVSTSPPPAIPDYHMGSLVLLEKIFRYGCRIIGLACMAWLILDRLRCRVDNSMWGWVRTFIFKVQKTSWKQEPTIIVCCIIPLYWVTFYIHSGIIPVGQFSRKCAKLINQA